jgi:hypothetical protein
MMHTIPLGGRLVYPFNPTCAGVWMYHCQTIPIAAHIANGLFGSVVIEPVDLAPLRHRVPVPEEASLAARHLRGRCRRRTG